MFFSGCLKYGERTWALKCGGINSIASSLSNKETSSKVTGPYHGREGGKKLDTEEVLLGAHYMRNVCKGMLADQAVMQKSEYEVVRQGIQLNGGMYLYELVAMELSLLYDILYTKAAVIHTWYGLCIRIISHHSQPSQHSCCFSSVARMPTSELMSSSPMFCWLEPWCWRWRH